MKVKRIIEIEESDFELSKADKIPSFGLECRRILVAVRDSKPYENIDVDNLRTEILKVAKEESKVEPIWAAGLRYSLTLIDNAQTVEPTFKPICEVKFDKEQLDELVEKAKQGVLATIERSQGEWIEGTQGYFCNKCDYYDKRYFEHNFCPNCGVKMQKGETQ